MSTYISKLAKETGKKVVDAKKGLILKVGQKDIDDAERSNPSNCGFAKAAVRQFKAQSAHFFRSVAWVETPRAIVKFNLPGSMQKEIVAFDRAKAMVPGTYKLSAVNPNARQNVARARNKARREKLGKYAHWSKGKIKQKPRFHHRTEDIRIVPQAKKK